MPKGGWALLHEGGDALGSVGTGEDRVGQRRLARLPG
jgi:hypothetical protein